MITYSPSSTERHEMVLFRGADNADVVSVMKIKKEKQSNPMGQLAKLRGGGQIFFENLKTQKKKEKSDDRISNG
jgi:hypothetical protein